MSVSFATVSSSGALVRTYQHLVDTVLDLSRVAANDSGEPPFVWARVAAPGRTDGALERAGRQTPYAAQTIGEDALRACRGAQREVTVPRPPAALAWPTPLRSSRGSGIGACASRVRSSRLDGLNRRRRVVHELPWVSSPVRRALSALSSHPKSKPDGSGSGSLGKACRKAGSGRLVVRTWAPVTGCWKRRSAAWRRSLRNVGPP